VFGPGVLFSRLAGFVSHYYSHPAYQPLWEKLNGHHVQVGINNFGSWMLSIVNGQFKISTVNITTGIPGCRGRAAARSWDQARKKNSAQPEQLPEIFPKPTITIVGPLRAFMRLGSTRDLSQARKLGLSLNGDLTLALSLAQIFKNPPMDFTERLSGWVGDHAAVRLTQWGSGIYRRLKQGPGQIAEMGTEYLQEEALLLPTVSEIEDWMNAVDTLRDDVERLSARINLLQSSAEHGHAE
jgi:ubiquinone biosynthesis protein UbiJ